MANLQADQWKKEAETLRARLASQKEATAAQGGGHNSPSTARSPLRQSTGSTGQGRPSIENRGMVCAFVVCCFFYHMLVSSGLYGLHLLLPYLQTCDT